MGRAEDIFDRIKVKGQEAITEFVETRHCEELFLDFKRSADQGKGRVLDQKDRNHLAKAISGFGNSEGGVIVWGLDCSKDVVGADVVKAKCPIFDVKKFASWIEGAVSGSTIPPHSGVLNDVVKTNEEDHGYVITYIPKSENVPHQTVKDLRYYIRAGSSFSPTPHQVLAGMFGRRPQPTITHSFPVGRAQVVMDAVSFTAGFLVRNAGPGIARDLFVSCNVLSTPGPNCRISYDSPEMFSTYENYNCFTSMGKQEVRLVPGSLMQMASLRMWIRPPFHSNLEIVGIFGCGNAPAYRFSFESSSSTIEALYRELIACKGTAKEEEMSKKFVKDVLSI